MVVDTAGLVHFCGKLAVETLISGGILFIFSYLSAYHKVCIQDYDTDILRRLTRSISKQSFDIIAYTVYIEMSAWMSASHLCH